MIKFNKKRYAFTLIELSLVMLVLGFLVVGIMSGRTIIYRSQAQNIISAVDQYKKATLIFFDTYGALPDGLTLSQCNQTAEFSALSMCDNTTGTITPPTARTATSYFGANYYATLPSYANSLFGPYVNLWAAKMLQAAKLISGVREMGSKSYLYGNDSTDYSKNGNLKSYYVAHFYGIKSSFDNDVYFQFNTIQKDTNGLWNHSARGLHYAEINFANDTSSAAKNFRNANSIALFNNNKYDPIKCPSVNGIGSIGGWFGPNCESGVGAVSTYIAKLIDQKIDDGIPGTGLVISVKGFYPSNNTVGADGTPDFCYNFNPQDTQDWANGTAIYVTKNQYSKRYGCNMLFALPKLSE